MVDADVSWEPGALIKLALQPVEFVGGCYRHKRDIESYPLGLIMERPVLMADPDTQLLEVAHVPGGFLSVSRSVFEKLAAAFPARSYEHGGRKFHAFFHVPPGGGEDGAFCDDWRSIGGQVWLDPELTLTHSEGARSYAGHVGNWLKAR
jgi:hypothetical protein